MARRYADLDPAVLRRAVKLAQLPGVTRTQAAARFGISLGMLRRALKEHAATSRPTRAELALHALTRAGAETAGELRELDGIASYLDYVNKDGSTAADVRRLLAELVDAGRIEIAGERWRLTGEFP